MPSTEEMQALRAAARAQFQKKRADEARRVHEALNREDRRALDRGMLGGVGSDVSAADVAGLQRDLAAREERHGLAKELHALAASNEGVLGGHVAVALGLPPDASAEAIALAQQRYASSGGGVRPENHHQSSSVQQPQQQQQQFPEAVGLDGGQKRRETTILVDEAAVQRHVEAQDVTVEKSEAELRQDRAEVALAKRRVIALQQQGLPVTKARQEILDAVAKHQVIVVIGETGSGKTTQIPQFLFEAGYAKVACTQPRRLAAMSVAERVATERNLRVGQEVGYNVRFDNKTTERTKIEFLTDGMMLKAVMSEPDLTSYGAIMIDEAHERSLSSDILLGFLRDLVRRRSDLRIVVCSATIEADKFVQFFGSAPLVRVSGRTFPVTTLYLPEPEEDYVGAASIAVVQTHVEQSLPGDILVFLPGQEAIDRCIELITEAVEAQPAGKIRPLVLLPVYSSLPADEQKRIYMKAPEGARKVVIATNIAETSITVDGIRYVIDTGLCKQKYYRSRTNMECLSVVPISRASAEQRKGRAGRTQEGTCLRLYTKEMYDSELSIDPVPEILRSNLSSILLTLKTLGIDNPLAFDFIDAPAADSICRALDDLLRLGALTRRGQLTKTGRRMSELPLEPALAKAVLAGQERYECGKEMCVAAAMLSLQNNLFNTHKDKKVSVEGLRRRFFVNTTGDTTGYVRLFLYWEQVERYSTQWCTTNGVNLNALQRAKDVRNQLLNAVDQLFSGTVTSSGGADVAEQTMVSNVTKALLAGGFANIAKLGLDGRTYVVAKTGVEASIFPGSILHQLTHIDRQLFDENQRKLAAGVPVNPSLVVPKFINVVHGDAPALVHFHELRELKDRAYLVHVSAIDPEWAKEVAPAGHFAEVDLTNPVAGTKRPR